MVNDAARKIEAGKAWYETLGLHWGSLHRNVTVQDVLAFNAAEGERGRINEANTPVLMPVLMVFVELFQAVEDASRACDEVLELVYYCAGISRCFVGSLVNAATAPTAMIMTLGEFKVEMERVRDFVRVFTTKKAYCCGKATLGSRDRATVVKLKVKLKSLLDAVLDCFPTRSNIDDDEHRDKLTFVSHVGEDKKFVRCLLEAMEEVNVPAFFDDDMALGTLSVDEMESRAKEADQAVVVLSRSFLTKEWPMKELNIFLENKIRIFPLFYRLTPDDIWEIIKVYDRQGV